jgi:hypothetical protein
MCQMYHWTRNRFGHTRWYSKLMRLKWKLVSIYLEIVLILTHCVERTIGSKIILDAPDGTTGDVRLVKSCFGPFGNGVRIGAS